MAVPGRGQECEELPEIVVITANGVRGRIAHRTQVHQKLLYRGIHFPPAGTQILRLRAWPLINLLSHRKPKSRRLLGATQAPSECRIPRTRSGLSRAHGFRNGCHWSFRNGRFPVATFLYAGAHSSVLAALLDDERRAAFRARLGDGQVRRGEIAIGIVVAAVENPARAASLAMPRRTNSPSLHFGHLMPSVFGRMYLHFG